jgi:ADP-heptose:LPS heptosyltransferase
MQDSQQARKPENPGASAKEILIVRQGDLRGFFLALGALETLRRAHPRARITLVVSPDTEAFAKLCPFADEVVCDLEHDDKRRRAARMTLLRRTPFDMVYDLDGDIRSETLLRGLKPRFGSGPASSGPTPSATFSSASKPGTVSEIQRLSGQLILAGVEFSRLPEPGLAWVHHKLGHPPRLTPEYFGISGRFALVSLTSEETDPDLHWPQPSVSALCKALAGSGITPVLTGERGSGSVAQSVEMAIRDAKNIVARADAAQLVSLAGAADFVIGPDSAAIQAAGILGTPCLVLATTKTARTGLDAPYSSEFITVHAGRIADIKADTLWQTLICWQRAGVAKKLEEPPANRHIAV